MHSPAPPEAAAPVRFVELPRGRLAVRTWGRGPPLILVHGGPGGSGRYWLRLPPALAAARTLVAVDLRGHGASERRGPYSIRGLGADLVDLRAALDLGECALLGHSFGVPVALEAALAEPAFSPLVLVGGFASARRMLVHPSGLATKLALGARLAGWNLARALGRAEPTRPFLRRLLARAAPLWEGPRTPPWLDDVLFEAVDEPLDAVVPLQWSLLAWSARGRLSQLRRPLQLVVGEHDRIARPGAASFARRARGSLVTLDGCGHSPFLDAPAEFAEAVLGFLEESSSLSARAANRRL